jgi:hypothetical protein
MFRATVHGGCNGIPHVVLSNSQGKLARNLYAVPVQRTHAWSLLRWTDVPHAGVEKRLTSEGFRNRDRVHVSVTGCISVIMISNR